MFTNYKSRLKMPTRGDGDTRSDHGRIKESFNSWTDDLPVCHMSGVGFSTNQIYREDGYRVQEHEFEDQSFHFRLDENTYFYGVFDGHEGRRASQFCAQTMPAEVLLGQLKGRHTDEEIQRVLLESFHAVENGYFESIDDLLAEKAKLQLQLQGLGTYEAFQKYPEEVDRLQAVQAEIASGTTAVVALLFKNKLYIANVGDSRALLCQTNQFGTPQVLQLSSDHNLHNEDELLRLSQLGLDVEKIRQRSKLGTQENTRCIGNYSIKGGYKDFDILSSAKVEPVIAEPEICGGIPIDGSCRFLLLMSDGLYKSLEEASGTQDPNVEICQMVMEQFSEQGTLNSVAQAVVDKIVRIHHDTYMSGTEAAKNCQKRDDITLLVRNFYQSMPRAINSPSGHRQSPALVKGCTIPTGAPEQYTLSSGIDMRRKSHPPYFTGTEASKVYPGEPVSSLDTITNTGFMTNESTSESGGQRLFEPPEDQSIAVDEDGRTNAYVDFTDLTDAIQQIEEQGLMPEILSERPKTIDEGAELT